MAGLYANVLPGAAGSSAPMLNIQGTSFQGAYMPNSKWQFYAPNFLPRAQMAPPTVLSECEPLVQCEKALKRQELEARELEVERGTLAHQLQKSKPQANAIQTRPRIEHGDRGDADIRSVQAQDLAAFKSNNAAMMRDMIKLSLREFGVAPLSQSQSNPKGKEPSQDLLQIMRIPI